MNPFSVRFWRRLQRDESGQATTEYILMLAILMGMLTMVFQKFLKPTFAKLRTFAVARLNSMLFGADLHQIRLSR